MPQTAIACHFMRGGSSRGPFFVKSDLPEDEALRDKVLLAVMGSPDRRQIDGLGGAHSLTSKVGIVNPSDKPGVDLEFLFAQLQPDKDTVDTHPNCGNMLAAVVPFALERGLIKAQGDTTTVTVLTLNTGILSDITVQTPHGQIEYAGDARIDSVPGTSAPIQIGFRDTEGSVAGSLLPTGHQIDAFTVEGLGQIEATCIDNGMPMVLVRAQDFHRTAYESVADLNQDAELKSWLEDLRIQAGHAMGLGDVADKNYPKMCLLAAPQHGGTVHTRCFIPHVCHDSIGVLAAVTVASACVLPETVAQGMAQMTLGDEIKASIEHPSGEFSVVLSLSGTRITQAALLRTARTIMKGEVMIPARVWAGKPA